MTASRDTGSYFIIRENVIMQNKRKIVTDMITTGIPMEIFYDKNGNIFLKPYKEGENNENQTSNSNY